MSQDLEPLRIRLTPMALLAGSGPTKEWNHVTPSGCPKTTALHCSDVSAAFSIIISQAANINCKEIHPKLISKYKVCYMNITQDTAA